MEQHPKTTVAIFPSPHVLSFSISETGAVELGNFEGKYLQVVLDNLSIDYKFVFPKEKQHGKLLPNGSWNGMIGMLQRGEADLAFTYLTVTEERAKVVNFSTVYTMDACIFVSVMPEDVKPLSGFLHIFDMTTWIAVFITFFIMPILFVKFQKRKYSLLKTFFKLFANFYGQIPMRDNNSLKYIILLATWLLIATVLSFSYSATLLSFLIQPIKEPMILTFKELSKAVQRGTHKATFYNFSIPFLLNSEDEDLNILGEIVKRNNWFVHSSKRGSFAYVKYHSIQASNRNAGKLVYSNHKDLYMSEETLYVSPMAFTYGKNFCCPTTLNSIILRLSAAGLYDKFLRDSSLKYFLKTHRRSETLRVTGSSLSISDLLGSFMLLSAGLSLSFCALLGEVAFSRIYPYAKIDKEIIYLHP
ncbi:glutamate receptor 2-like [Argiope bruennichi]|uniref:glutamate receptor 2-like n=1 Tax=Argiope bruennichi TaxID=94029 RepID=UPI002494620E|nr:glutamate receptor 2-like [Argiope bruennichi]